MSAIVLASVVLCTSAFFFGVPFTFNPLGDQIDEFNGVGVFYNGNFGHVEERNVTASGYNIGLKWQCVEFVKRYYLEVYICKCQTLMARGGLF